DTTLAAGTYNGLKVTATDKAGNSSTTTNAQTIIVDATNPTESFPTETLRLHIGTSVTVRIPIPAAAHFADTVADTGGAGIDTVNISTAATQLRTPTLHDALPIFDTTLAAGTYNGLKVTATDKAGNSSTTTNAQTIVVDATNPTESFPTVTLTLDSGVSGTDYITNAGGVHFAGTVADTRGSAIDTVKVFNGATLLGTDTVLGGNWSLDTTLAAATYTHITFTALFRSGNSSTTTNAQTIVVDATNPTESFPTVTLTLDSGVSGTDYITNAGGVHFAG